MLLRKILLLTVAWIMTISLAFAGELVLVGIYHGTNIYIQNPHDGNDVFCVKEIYVNDKKIDVPQTTAFDIDLSFLEKGQPVVIRIYHGDNCVPKVLNPQAIRAREPFQFVGVSVNAEGIVWSTKGEKRFGQFFIQAKRNKSWIIQKVVACKGDANSNVYTIPVSHINGENYYRIKYLDVTGKYYFSDEVKYLSVQEEVTFYPKSVTSKISFSAKVKYEIINDKGKVLKSGEGISVDCSDLQMGAYTLRFEGKEERFFKK